MVQLLHPYTTTGKTIALTFIGRVTSLLFHMLSRLVIAFLPRSNHLLISWLQSPSAVILEPPGIKSLTVSIVSPSICHEVMGLDAMLLVFWMLSFKPAFSLSSVTFIKRLFSSSAFCHKGGVINDGEKKVKVKSLSHVRLFVTPCTVAHQAPPSMEFSRQEYWGGLPFPSPGDLPDPRIEPGSPALWAGALPSKPPGNQWWWALLKTKRVADFEEQWLSVL